MSDFEDFVFVVLGLFVLGFIVARFVSRIWRNAEGVGGVWRSFKQLGADLFDLIL